ncbi:unnamed protein product [Linum tenue]|uniref:DEAD/DEAH-box helicase domain-containing protein n=1 Tax=Linum tenue TaxID=586396 RepID=A0AAV0JLD3_9ROSI|nr:unnamed protein product [Linum tenue]
MAKGDDAVARKKNKSRRKKMNSDTSSSAVSVRVASIIAAKKRRLSGKRRQCQGMCFSLPTPDDPFNDRSGKTDFSKKDSKKTQASKSNHQRQAGGNSGCPSKFLLLCLNAIESALRLEGLYGKEEDKPLFVDPWGVEFLKCYAGGKDIMETSGSSCTIEQMAWMVSIAADSITRKEKEGLSFTGPFLLFLVSSQEKAIQVRSVCKPLKPLGIHTVSLHPGASLEHQMNGLKSCEPEFLVSTPERLLELVSLKAINISDVSFLVVDELEPLSKDGSLDALNSIRQSISGSSRVVVFGNHNSSPAIQKLLPGPVSRLSLDQSVRHQSAHIGQKINVCPSAPEKILKVCALLHI